MILTEGQQHALQMARGLTRYEGEPYLAVLAGYAGTGKTTTLQMIAEELGSPIVVAPTGKAALRVREATGLTARTIHSWLYTAKEDERTGEVIYTPKDPDEIDRGEVPLLVIDEASMVPEHLWNDIWNGASLLQMNVLIVGDPFQLPPVVAQRDRERSGPEFSLLSRHFQYHARVLLTEVVRQALESPIIRASMQIRNGDPAGLRELEQVNIKDLVPAAAEALRGNAAIITHKNDTRNTLNLQIREAMGLPEDLQPGEPLLVLKNNYRTQRFNGEVIRFESWDQDNEPAGVHKVRDWIRKQEGDSRFGIAILEPDPLTGLRTKTILCEEQIFGRFQHIHEFAITKTARKIYGGGIADKLREDETDEERNARLGTPIMHVNLGYALTCHKSQGSEWDTVLVNVEPSVRLDKLEGRRWLYTAISRARQRTIVCV